MLVNYHYSFYCLNFGNPGNGEVASIPFLNFLYQISIYRFSLKRLSHIHYIYCWTFFFAQKILKHGQGSWRPDSGIKNVCEY